jgi:hypothetical protein
LFQWLSLRTPTWSPQPIEDRARALGEDLGVGADGDFQILRPQAALIRVLFDHALEQADGEGDAAGLDRLQVARRQQAQPVAAAGHQLGRGAQVFALGAAHDGEQVGCVRTARRRWRRGA